jgi:hypothetical protein
VSYDAIYAAVRSRISGCDAKEAIYTAVTDALQSNGVDYHLGGMCNAIQEAATAPHVLLRPHIYVDGNKWCCMYGDNLMDGVAGFGDTPAEAAAEFDRNWREQTAVQR